jgi:hypothetical protein
MSNYATAYTAVNIIATLVGAENQVLHNEHRDMKW